MQGFTDEQYQIIKKVREQHDKFNGAIYRDINFFKVIALNMISSPNSRKSWVATSNDLNVPRPAIQRAQRRLAEAGLLDLAGMPTCGVNFVNKKDLSVFKPVSIFDVSAVRR